MHFLLPTCIFLLYTYGAISAQSYKAGVVLYKIVQGPAGATVSQLMRANAAQYKKLMESVKDKVDILVFPEYGLTTFDIITSPVQHLDGLSTVVEKVGTQLCEPNNKGILGTLACAAKENKLYAVVNLLEKDDKSFYVTSVGLDPNGAICLRCRKRRLFKGVHFSTPPADEISCMFTANFSAASIPFSVMFETDMLYQTPKETKDVIMTSSITNGLPLEFGLSLESGFAVGNDVNLLVSGIWEDTRKFGGSGIYHRNGTAVVAMSGEEIPNALNGSAILIRDVQLKSEDRRKVNFKAELYGKIPSLNVAYKSITGLADTKKNVDKHCLEGEKFCCTFSADLDQDSISPYSWVAISNKTTILDQTLDVFICALVKPSAGASPIKFKNVSITSNLKRSQAHQTLPISLKKELLPAAFVYEDGETGTSITLDGEAELLTFGIVQVVPPKGGGGGSSNTALIVVIVLLLVLVVAVGVFLIWRKRQRKNRSAL